MNREDTDQNECLFEIMLPYGFYKIPWVIRKNALISKCGIRTKRNKIH